MPECKWFLPIFIEMKLNIDTSAVVKLTNKLEKLHRSALPNAIRNALNSAAFDVKQNTMPKSAAVNFEKRQPNFFKANSRVDMAKGFDVNQMKATVGFVEAGLKGGNNFAVKNLEQQEDGGTINKKSFIPMDAARGGNKSRPVRPGNRLSSINKIVNSNTVNAKSEKQQFMKAVKIAGVGGFVIGNRKKKVLWRVNSMNLNKGKLKLTPIYTFKQNRSVRVKPTGFMETASIESAKKIEDFYIKEAKKQIKRLLQ